MLCLNCNKETSKWGSRYKKYCSITCAKEYENKIRKNNFNEKKCEICGNIFTPRNTLNKYCSKRCKVLSDMQKRSKKPKTKICSFCKKEFIPYTSLDKFCSSKCRLDSLKSTRKFNWNNESIEKRMGENNPGYRHGQYKRGFKQNGIGQRFFTKNAIEIEQKMIDDIGYKCCEYCGVSNPIKFERHHIIFRSEKPNHPHLHDKENIYILCIQCHNEFHKHKSLRNQLVINRNLNEIFGDDVLDK
jgi:hypothetical protein